MQRISIALAVAAILVVVSQYASSQQAEAPAAPQPQALMPVAPAGLFHGIEPGQVVGMERTGDAYRVTINPRWRTRDVYTVVAAGPEGLILETQNRDLELRVPVTSILEVAISRSGVR